MDYQVILSPCAVDDLRAIVRYVTSDDPVAAARLGEGLLSATKRLATFPELGRFVPEFTDPMIREIVVRPYRIVHRVDHPARRVEVARFWHGARGNPEL